MTRGRRRIHPDMYAEIHRRVREGRFTNARELYRELCAEFPDKVPSERTVRNIVNELLPPDPSGPWEPGPDDDPVEAALVLETMAVRLERVRGRSWEVNREEARWIAWIRTGWPDLDPLVAAVLAVDYRARRETGRPTQDLDAYLAYAPWRSCEAMARFDKAVKKGLIPSPPLFYHTAAAVMVTRREIAAETPKHDTGEVKTDAKEGDR